MAGGLVGFLGKAWPLLLHLPHPPRTKGTAVVEKAMNAAHPVSHEQEETEARWWAGPAWKQVQAFLEPRLLCSAHVTMTRFRGQWK